MLTSLKALGALSVLCIGACASTGVEDELAGESTTDDAVDGKADAAVDGAYTYFEVSRDMRRCVSPLCGGYFFERLNRTTTVCVDGSIKASCYAAELDFSESKLSDDLQNALVDAAGRDAVAPGAVAIVRGRFATKKFTGFGNLGRFVVTEAWIAENDAPPSGVFVKVHDNNVRCIQAPCPTITEKALNTSRSANIHGLDWSVAGFEEDQISKMQLEMVDHPSGVIIAGDRYTFTENHVNAKGRTVTAAYRRLMPPESTTTAP